MRSKEPGREKSRPAPPAHPGRYAPKFRPNLTDYEILIMALVDKLNEKSVYKMNKTDAVKIAVEKAVKKVLPDVVIKPKRKRYIEFPDLEL